MKKIITLLFSVGVFTTSFAQYNHGQSNDNWNSRRNDQYATSSNDQYDNHDRNDRNFFHKENSSYAREKNFQIDKINREFDYRVNAIQNDRYMRRREKKMAIRNAEIERARQIQMLNARANDRFHNGYGQQDNGRR